jgi:AcrR family transcriptional regulator
MRMVEAQDKALSLRGVAREVGVAATSVYLHFPDLDHLLGALVTEGFERLTIATSNAAEKADDPADELRARCRAYCRFGLENPRLYRLMFQVGLPLAVWNDPAQTPGRKSFENLVGAVRRCIEAGVAPDHEDPFRLASLIWTADHGLILARISRPTFPWAPLDGLVDEMVNRMMGFRPPA